MVGCFESRRGSEMSTLIEKYGGVAKVSASLREVAILVIGAHFRSAYEIYAHVLVAEARQLPDDKIATIVAGQRPSDVGEWGSASSWRSNARRRRRPRKSASDA